MCMDPDVKHARISVIVHAVAAVIIAFISYWIRTPLYAGVIGIIVLVAIGYPLARFTGKRGFTWWLANGILVYLLLWLVGWTYLFNAGI